MGQKVINFTGLGSAPKVPIPAGYQGFNWLGYTNDGVFEGAVNVANKTPPYLYGVGFSATLVDTNSVFKLNNVLIVSASSDPDPVEVEVIGFQGTNTIYSQTIVLTDSPSRISLPSQIINQVQFKSIALSSFRVFEIVIETEIAAGSPPAPPTPR